MDLYQLRYFLEVAREKNFTRAAVNMGVSTPAVSKSVSLLEQSLGKRLFHRTRRRVALTAEGEALRIRVERAFDELEKGRMEATGEAPSHWGMLRIGSREMVTHYLLPSALASCAKASPRTRAITTCCFWLTFCSGGSLRSISSMAASFTTVITSIIYPGNTDPQPTF